MIGKSMLDGVIRYVAKDRLEALLEAPLSWLPESPTAILPSLVLANDGVSLGSLLVVSSSYLCEIRGLTPGRQDFDYIAKKSIANYRIAMWTQEIKEGDVVKATFEVAQVVFMHGAFNQSTQISYAGDARAQWLKELKEAIPISVVVSVLG